MALTGKRARKIRHELVARQKSRCCYCKRIFGKKGTPLAATIEHVVARADGGTNRQSNLAAACRHCNQLRGRQKEASRRNRRKRKAAAG